MFNAHFVFRLSYGALLRSVTLFVLIALISPTFLFFGDVRNANAAPANRPPVTPPPPISAPPQAFKVGSGESSTPVSVRVAVLGVSVGGWVKDVIGGPTLPEGLKAPNTVGVVERITSTVGSWLAIAAPKAKNEETAPAPQPAPAVDFDFDEDGKADLARWNPANTEFRIKNSGGESDSVYTIGSSAAKPVPADYDDDGKADAATFASGTWTIRKSSDGTTSSISFGQAGDIPASGNYRNTTADELAYFRPSNGTWYWREFGNATVYTQSWGQAGDIAVAGDYDADGEMDPAIFRPSTGVWWVTLSSTSSYTNYAWGSETDVPVPADYDGDGKTDAAIYRPSTGGWWALKSSDNNASWYSNNWGSYGDQPVVGDFSGDGRADYVVWRPSSGNWYILRSSDGNGSMQNLGVPGDTAVPSVYIKQTGSQIAPDAISKARLTPKNATGGMNLYSQNFSWGTSLVGLPGRAGLDMGIGISYNSLVWTKVGTSMLFDTNVDNVSPGFRLGFPTVEPAYYDDDTDKWNYLMVTPSGGRMQFRQSAAGNTYETVDSSYLQLETIGADNPNDPVEDITIKVTGTDGTQMAYVWKEGAFRCTEIKDRNGNFITIAYNAYGYLTTVTDTLNRVITVNYDSEYYPTTITQVWKDNNGGGSNVTHTWATLAYTTKPIATDFDASLTSFGPPNGTNLKVLEKVTYPDSSFTKFTYNGYAQVSKIENIAADSTSHVLNSVRTNLELPSADQTDCPRFTQTKQFVENFNGGAETTTSFTITPSQTYTLPGSISGSATLIVVEMDDHPHNAISKSYIAGSGLFEGLTIATEDWADGTSGSERKRWTWTDWAQDDPYAATAVNPRVKETRVGDGTNVKKTTLQYLGVNAMHPASEFGLVKEVNVFASDLSTVLKKATTEYDLSSTYIDRRIIGLPSKTEAWGWNDLTSSLEYVSKATYAYDEGNFSDSGLVQNISPVQQDNTNYSSSFIAGRANLTSTTRWDVTDASNSAAAVSSSVKYNTAGAVVSQTTPWDGTNTRTVKIGYADNFNSSPGVSTYAYPTTVTDPANNSSTVIYRYDIGANVEANSPAPAGQTYGKKTKRLFDSLGRLERNSVYVNTTEHSYVRYEFPTNGVQSKVYAPIVDVDGDGNIAEDEVYSESWSDGAGRTLRSRTEHPGSTGGWSTTLAEYDILGQVKRQTVPTETNSSYQPAGDDLTRGFLWTHQKYDWMGRVVRKIATDGTDSPTANDSDIFISYQGCGCAGGLETTIQGELVPRDDVANTNARRTQKTYADILGRTWKTVLYKWDGTTPFTTTEQSFNGRDQILKTKQTDNTSLSSPQTHQDVLTTYDGHGRTKTRHNPIEDAETETTWNYNPDDSAAQVIDPRGVVTDIEYNSVGLKTEIAYTPTGSIPDTPTVTFTFDNLGNRTSMDTAGVNATTYAYDSLSRITSETVDFDDLEDNYTIAYSYQLTGGLKSITDPFSAVVNYMGDKAGRVTSITGSGFASVSTYATGIKFRAFGAVKEMTYGSSDSSVVSYTFNDRLKPESYQATSSVLGSSFVRKANYEYFADGRAKAVDNVLDGTFDQEYSYDHMGRIKGSTSGLVTNSEEEEVPAHAQILSYNAFGDMASRSSSVWGSEPYEFSGTYVNGRKQGGNEVFDLSGNILDKTLDSSNYERWSYDASGVANNYEKAYEAHDGIHYYITNTLDQKSDGDGLNVVRHSERDIVHAFPSQSSYTEYHAYFVRSTVLGGQVLTEVDEDGEKVKTKVYAGAGDIAEQVAATSEVAWKHRDLVTGSISSIKASGHAYWGGANDSDYNAELEPFGADIPKTDPFPGAGDPDTAPMPTKFKLNGNVFNQEIGCQVESMPAFCNPLLQWVNGRNPGGYVLSLWQYKVYQRNTAPDTTPYDTTIGGDDPINIGDTDTLIDTYYSVVSTPLPDLKLVTETAEFYRLLGDPYLAKKAVFDCSGDGAVTAYPFVNSLVSDDFDKAMSNINSTIGNIGFTEMFRTTEHQKELKAKADQNLKDWNASWNPLKAKPLPAAEPGTSSHEAGFSFDISAVILDGARGKQIIQMLNNSGFYQDVAGDQPHFTYNLWFILSDEQKRNAVSSMQANAVKLGLPATVGQGDAELRKQKARDITQCK